MVRRCPLCCRETNWEDNPWRPFCSERCQIIDLGRWASEEYRVSASETTEGLTTDFSHEVNHQVNADEQV